MNPLQVIIDQSTGAKIAHFAAHHGDVKFMRWLVDDITQKAMNKEDILTRFREDKDMYGCSLVVYAARQGHFPMVMYLIEELKVDPHSKDRFGNSACDYVLTYKKLWCFIYLFFVHNVN